MRIYTGPELGRETLPGDILMETETQRWSWEGKGIISFHLLKVQKPLKIGVRKGREEPLRLPGVVFLEYTVEQFAIVQGMGKRGVMKPSSGGSAAPRAQCCPRMMDPNLSKWKSCSDVLHHSPFLNSDTWMSPAQTCF